MIGIGSKWPEIDRRVCGQVKNKSISKADSYLIIMNKIITEIKR